MTASALYLWRTFPSPDAEQVFGAGDLGEILDRGVLRVATLNGATTYYEGGDGAAGFEHDLARGYAEHLGVELEVVVANSLADALAAVDDGRAELAAAAVALTPERSAERRFAPAYATVNELVICRRGAEADRARADLTQVEIVIAEGAAHEVMFERLEDTGVLLNWRVAPDADVPTLLAAVSAGEEACTIVDEREFALNRRYFPDLRSVETLPGGRQLAWALGPRQDSASAALSRDLEDWFEADGAMRAARLEERYFGFRPEEIGEAHAAAFRNAVERALPRYRPLFEAEGERHDVPWTLLAAVGYQESHWNPTATSPTGVRGLMMLTRPTAAALGVSDRLDPEQAVEGGARYLRRLYERFEGRVIAEDQWWFAAASYNMGYGHVTDAQNLLQTRGGDPASWAEVREILHELEDPEVYRGLHHGYGAGRQAQDYVRRVRDFADVLDQRYSAPAASLSQADRDAEAAGAG